MREVNEKGTPRICGRMLMLAAASAMVLSGCISPAFRESVGRFGAATKVAVSSETERLGRIQESEEGRQRDELIADRTAYLIVQPTEACARLRSGLGTGECRLVRRDGRPLRNIPRSEHIIALGNALANYSDALVALAADSTEDQAAFTASVTGLGTSLSNLNNAIRTATGEPESDLSAPIGAIAGLVAELGNLYFQHRRNVVLRRVIVQGETAVRRALTILRQVAETGAQYERLLLGGRLLAAQSNYATVMTNASSTEEARREAQQGLFDSVNALNRYDTQLRLFDALGEAHRKLVEAARRGATAAELSAALEATLHLVTTIRETAAAIS